MSCGCEEMIIANNCWRRRSDGMPLLCFDLLAATSGISMACHKLAQHRKFTELWQHFAAGLR